MSLCWWPFLPSIIVTLNECFGRGFPVNWAVALLDSELVALDTSYVAWSCVSFRPWPSLFRSSCFVLREISRVDLFTFKHSLRSDFHYTVQSTACFCFSTIWTCVAFAHHNTTGLHLPLPPNLLLSSFSSSYLVISWRQTTSDVDGDARYLLFEGLPHRKITF